MIQRFTRLSFRAFKGFTWPGDLDAFARFNLIYGWNGSGKTTLSSLLRGVELHQAPADAEAELEIDGRMIDVRTLPATGVPPIRVFNKDFTANAVLRIETDLAPIYYFGEESVEKRKKVEQLKRELVAAETALEKANDREAKSGKALDKFCIDQARALKQLLTGARSPNWCNNYDKKRLRETAERLMKAPSEVARVDPTQEVQLKGRKDAQPKPSIDLPALSLDEARGLGIEIDALLTRSILSQGIQELVTDSGSSRNRVGEKPISNHSKIPSYSCGNMEVRILRRRYSSTRRP